MKMQEMLHNVVDLELNDDEEKIILKLTQAIGRGIDSVKEDYPPELATMALAVSAGLIIINVTNDQELKIAAALSTHGITLRIVAQLAIGDIDFETHGNA